MTDRRQSLVRFAASGAGAGVISALGFTVLHQLLINPIWFALPAMLVAGAICGLCLAWSYGLVVPASTRASWLRYNLLFLLMFIALGLTSLAAFEPITTIAALLQRPNEPPRELIGRALPVTGLFTLATVMLLGRLYRPGWRGAGALLVTTTVLVLVLGLNISILGLVQVPRAAMGVFAEVLALLLALVVIYVVGVLLMSRARFRGW